MRLLRSYKFVCPCNMFSLLTEVISSICCYVICSLMASAHRGPNRDTQILLLFLFPEHFVKEKEMKNAIEDV